MSLVSVNLNTHKAFQAKSLCNNGNKVRMYNFNDIITIVILYIFLMIKIGARHCYVSMVTNREQSKLIAMMTLPFAIGMLITAETC